MLQEMTDIDADECSRKMLPSRPRTTNALVHHADVREKYVWTLLFASLIATVLMLDSAMTSQYFINDAAQVTSRRSTTSSWDRSGNVNDSASSLEASYGSPFINDAAQVTTSNWNGNVNDSASSSEASYSSPPTGFPWHRWASSDVDVQSFIQELGTIDIFSHELSDPKKPMPTTFFKPKRYRNLIPYVIRNGAAFHPKRKETWLKMNRWKEFESVLLDSLRLASNLQHADSRLEVLVTNEFPFIVANGDTPWCNNERNKKIPIFTWCTIKTCNYTWPVPNGKICSNKRACTEDWKQQFTEWNDQYPWEAKLPQAVWRGTMNGPNGLKDWRDLPRAKLVQMSLNTTTMDAGFAVIGKDVEQEARQDSRVVPRMLEEDYMKYR